MTEINPALLIQQGTVQNSAPKMTVGGGANPYNLVNVATAEEVGNIAKKEIGTMPYRVATAGYSVQHL